MVPSSVPALIAHGVVKFASEPAEYGNEAALVAAIGEYLERYVDLEPRFARLSAYYALLTWVFDRFNELPYLRRRGDYGTGKTRFLITLGSICYKPIFAGGASTVSPIFHLLDRIGGTLIIDEADYRFSDETALIAKILNNGNVRGFPILRSESVNGRDFRPRAFSVFGPKLVAMRGRYDDAALESRFLTDEIAAKPLRPDIPVNLPPEQEAEALELRNKLLLYRFRAFAQAGAPAPATDARLEPRLNQILAPLFSLIGEAQAREDLYAYARACQEALDAARGQSFEAELLCVLRHLSGKKRGASLPLQEIARVHARYVAGEGGRALSSRAMGHALRTRLNLPTRKSHGVYGLPAEAAGALERLCARFGVGEADAARVARALADEDEERPQTRVERVDFGDLGDLPVVT